jgi:peptidoglycan/xylan/chitin deacetylase (PgdA/CDA1 family)
MRPVRPVLPLVVCLCLVLVSASCGGHAESSARPGAAGQSVAARVTNAVSHSSTTVPQVRPSPTPPNYDSYVVDFGDTLGVIAERFGVSESLLVSLNHITNVNDLQVGQRLLLPMGSVKPTAAPHALDSVRVPILLYHHIGWLLDTAGQEWQVTTVTPNAFEEQMSYLAYNGYHTVKVADVVDAIEGRTTLPSNPVIVTFDDGWIDGWQDALPVLQKYGMIATFFIPAQWIGSADEQIMNWAQVEALSQAGMEIGSHAMTHPYLNQLDLDQLTWELQESRSILQEHTGQPVDTFAYNFGIYDYNVLVQVQAAGYRAALTINDGLYVSANDLYEMPRLTVPYGGDLDTFKVMLGENGD